MGFERGRLVLRLKVRRCCPTMQWICKISHCLVILWWPKFCNGETNYVFLWSFEWNYDHQYVGVLQQVNLATNCKSGCINQPNWTSVADRKRKKYKILKNCKDQFRWALAVVRKVDIVAPWPENWFDILEWRRRKKCPVLVLMIAFKLTFTTTSIIRFSKKDLAMAHGGVWEDMRV